MRGSLSETPSWLSKSRARPAFTKKSAISAPSSGRRTKTVLTGRRSPARWNGSRDLTASATTASLRWLFRDNTVTIAHHQRKSPKTIDKYNKVVHVLGASVHAGGPVSYRSACLSSALSSRGHMSSKPTRVDGLGMCGSSFSYHIRENYTYGHLQFESFVVGQRRAHLGFTQPFPVGKCFPGASRRRGPGLGNAGGVSRAVINVCIVNVFAGSAIEEECYYRHLYEKHANAGHHDSLITPFPYTYSGARRRSRSRSHSRVSSSPVQERCSPMPPSTPPPARGAAPEMRALGTRWALDWEGKAASRQQQSSWPHSEHL
ncbi:hypothetical protein DL768_011001 [Monosporascus sp. mg162]|nr:hypothetical protein DL768_011001 [Monosporascus sp. mg162]